MGWKLDLWHGTDGVSQTALGSWKMLYLVGNGQFGHGDAPDFSGEHIHFEPPPAVDCLDWVSWTLLASAAQVVRFHDYLRYFHQLIVNGRPSGSGLYTATGEVQRCHLQETTGCDHGVKSGARCFFWKQLSYRYSRVYGCLWSSWYIYCIPIQLIGWTNVHMSLGNHRVAFSKADLGYW